MHHSMRTEFKTLGSFQNTTLQVQNTANLFSACDIFHKLYPNMVTVWLHNFLFLFSECVCTDKFVWGIHKEILHGKNKSHSF